jgi:radical SAM enzyme (TIGR01210 family)
VFLPPAGRARRQGKVPVDPLTPLGTTWEDERQTDGSRARVLALLLAGAECPFSCVFCDLWRRTLDGSTPQGAIPAQIDHALTRSGPVPAGSSVKLYNASNFFDARAVPPEDDRAIARLVAPFARVIVESHPRLIGQRCLNFAARLNGTLEVAVGLETANPEVLARLDKGMTLEDFDRAADRLSGAGVGLRVFLLLPPPFLAADDACNWIVRSVDYAVARGAAHVSLIPTRIDEPTPGAWSQDTVRPSLAFIENVVDRTVTTTGTVVTLDLWDIDHHVTCTACRAARVARLHNINLTGRAVPRVACLLCTSSS